MLDRDPRCNTIIIVDTLEGTRPFLGQTRKEHPGDGIYTRGVFKQSVLRHRIQEFYHYDWACTSSSEP